MFKKMSPILVAFAMTATGLNAAAGQANSRVHAVLNGDFKAPARPFLKPLVFQSVLSLKDPMIPRICAGEMRCPPIVSNRGVGVLPQLEPKITANLPNVRVSFFIQEISNEIIANGGVETAPGDFEFVEWLTTGSEADEENGGPFGWSLPGPGDTYNNFGAPHAGPFGLMVYDALVLGACESLTSFDVQHEATIMEAGADIGSFVGVDNSTIDSTGYYNLNYTVRATDSDGGVSDFHFSGKAHVLCSGLNTLP